MTFLALIAALFVFAFGGGLELAAGIIGAGLLLDVLLG